MTSVHRVGYIGNFSRTFCTEVHVSQALASHGHVVVPWQENEIDFRRLGAMAVDAGVDFVMWTRTWALDVEAQLEGLAQLEKVGIPTVGYHLDRWWGLAREHQVKDEPFFRQALMVTADGGHDDEWVRAGVNHRWFPPAVLGSEAAIDVGPDPAHVIDVTFVGSWERYHPEWQYRMDLIAWLRNQYARHNRLALWPQQGQPVRGLGLNRLYQSARVVIGDSCLAGSPSRYWSDRVSETVGRGGFLIHPYVEGIEDHYTPDQHLVLYELGDWPTLRNLVDAYLADPEERARVSAAGRAHVLAHHTYEVRMAQLIDLLHAEGIVPHPDAIVGQVNTHDRAGLSARFDLRPGSDDAIVVNEVWRENTYGLDPADVAGRWVIDIGANVGAFTVWAAKAGAVHVDAYEPEPGNVEALRANIALNGAPVSSATTVHADAVMGMTYPTGVPLLVNGASSMIGAGPGATLVPAVGVQAAIDNTAGFPIVLKLDCEGSEYEIIEGIEDWSRIDRIVMEFHGPEILGLDPDALDGDFGSMVETMAEHGHVTILGRPSVGGMITWRTYGP